MDSINEYRLVTEPVATVASTRLGKARYRGIDPNVNSRKVLRRPMLSDNAAHAILPPVRFQV